MGVYRGVLIHFSAHLLSSSQEMAIITARLLHRPSANGVGSEGMTPPPCLCIYRAAVF